MTGQQCALRDKRHVATSGDAIRTYGIHVGNVSAVRSKLRNWRELRRRR